MERLGYQKNESLYTLFDGSYLPPLPINKEPFQGIRKSDFLFQRSNGEYYDPDLFKSCIKAILRTSSVIDSSKLSSEMQIAVRQCFSKEEKEKHLEQYVNTAINVIDFLSKNVERVSVSGIPVGGLAPFDAVMREAVKYPNLCEKVNFIPLIHQPKIYELIRGCQAHVIIDDGFGSGIDQTVELYVLEDKVGIGQTQFLTRQIREVRNNCGTYASPQSAPLYKDLISKFHNHNIVTLPFYMRNPLFQNLLIEHIESFNNNFWAHAQKSVLSSGAIGILNEDDEVVGASMRGVPCRDLGVSLNQIGEISLSLKTKLENGGFKGSDKFRLLADREDVLAIKPKFIPFIMESFIAELNKAI